MTLTATLVEIDTFSLFIRPSKCNSQWASVNKQASESGNESTLHTRVYEGTGGGQSIWRDGGHGMLAKDTCYVNVMRHKTNSRQKYPPSILKPKYSCQLVKYLNVMRHKTNCRPKYPPSILKLKYSCQLVKYLIMNSSRMKLLPKIHAS